MGLGFVAVMVVVVVDLEDRGLDVGHFGFGLWIVGFGIRLLR